MKRNWIPVFAGMMVLAIVLCAVAWAGPLDTVKGWAGELGWKAIAGILSAVLLIGGVAARAQWLSGILIAIGSILMASGGMVNWSGVVLQDGKITEEEAKQAKPQWMMTLETIAHAWASIRGKPANG